MIFSVARFRVLADLFGTGLWSRSDVVVVLVVGDGPGGEGHERPPHGAGLDVEHGHLRLGKFRPRVSTLDGILVPDTFLYLFSGARVLLLSARVSVIGWVFCGLNLKLGVRIGVL